MNEGKDNNYKKKIKNKKKRERKENKIKNL